MKKIAVNRIEYTVDTKCSYAYFWPQDCDFIFELITKNIKGEDGGEMINVDFTKDGDLFGIELLFVDKSRIKNEIKETLKEVYPELTVIEFCGITEL